MKHFILLICAICMLSYASKAQVYPFSDGFETFSPLGSPAGIIGAGYQTDSFKLFNSTHAYVSGQCATLRLTTTFVTDSIVTPVIGALTGSSELVFYLRSGSTFGPYPARHRLRAGEFIDVSAINTSSGAATLLVRIDSSNQNAGAAYQRYNFLLGALSGANVRIKYNAVGNTPYFVDLDSITLRDTVVPPFHINPVVTTPRCTGGSDGVIHLYPSGGVSPYTYLWTDSLGSTLDSLTGLAPGNYTVTVRDFAGDTVRQTITVGNPAAGMTSTTSRTSTLCAGDSNGTATVHVSSGTRPYTYAWSNGSTDSTATGLAAGAYTVTVTDGNGCSITRTVNVNDARAMVLQFTTTNETAPGAADGSSRVRVVTGGTPGFAYLWGSGGSVTSATNINLTSGVYCVTVTDTNGCTASGCDTISVALEIKLNELFHQDALCVDDTSGRCRIRGINGTGPYTYLWSDGSTAANHTGLAAGLYVITITDNTGRTGIDSVIITSPPAITGVITVSPASSASALDGTASVLAGGGVSPYSYLWSPNGEVSSSINGLAVGSYSVEITDSNGCVNTFTAFIVIAGITKNEVGADTKIYPVPANNVLFVELGAGSYVSYRITDLSGKVLFEKGIESATKMQRIDLNSIAAGQYFIEISEKSGTKFSRKFIKE